MININSCNKFLLMGKIFFLIFVSILFSDLLEINLTKRAACLDDYEESQQRAEKKNDNSNYYNLMIEIIELKRRNWENHGTDVNIYSDGRYLVWAVFLGKAEKVREGITTQYELKDLKEAIKNARFFSLKHEYQASFKTDWKWWGYEIIIKTNRGLKSVRFHSEDENVPDNLKLIVKKIRDITK